MRLVDFRLHSYTLPLTREVRFGSLSLAQREGVLLRIETEAGEVGWGDAAPLPGFSAESLPAVRQQLEKLLPVLQSKTFEPDDVLSPSAVLSRALDGAALYPSARFAIDLALCEVAAIRNGTSLPEALGSNAATTLPLNALITDAATAEKQAADLVRHGYTTIKVKVGASEPKEAARLIRRIRSAADDSVRIRADANQGWSYKHALSFAHSLSGEQIDYIEEPLRKAARLPELWLETSLPIALDESLAEEGAIDRLDRWPEAVVIKPTVIGGVAATLGLADRARGLGLRVVLSGAFESGIGMRGVAALAAVTGAEPAGLDPYRLLATDVLAERLPFDRPRVDIEALFSKPARVRLP